MSRKIKRILHICIIITIIIAIGFAALMLILRYIENGETNMPFEISKITIVSTVDAQDVEDKTNKWNLKVSQNNDIYIDVKKNEDYSQNRIIKSVTLSNFNIIKKSISGDIINIYKPSTNEVRTFENKDEFKVQGFVFTEGIKKTDNDSSEIIFVGDKETNIKKLKISNQGGRLAFRCANVDLGNYVSNEENDLNYKDLLKKLGHTDEELISKITFDVEILLTNKKSFKATIEVDVPVSGVVEQGTSSKEIENPNVVFKRVEN